jgi:hypothetical protein
MINRNQEKITTDYILQEYDKLVSCKSLGFYNCCEVTSIFLIVKDLKQTFNVYTIFVFEERLSYRNENRYITPKLIPLSDNCSIGIKRRMLNINEIRPIVKTLCDCRDEGKTDIGEGTLQIGILEVVPKVFVQQNSTKEILLNKVLKNNFKNGCYLIEFFDVEKSVRKLLDEKRLKKLAQKVFDLIPIDLFSVLDRIGNFIFQFPSVSTNITYTTDKEEMMMQYHVNIDDRLGEGICFQLQSELEYDNNIVGFGTALCHNTDTDVSFQVGDSSHMCRTTLMDLNNQLILARQDTVFIRQIDMDMQMGLQYGEKRLIYSDDGKVEDAVYIISAERIRVNQPIVRKREDAINQRQYNRRVEDLYARRDFRCYGNTSDDEEAIQDMIQLLNMGEGGKVYLWDPYLTVEDILHTWYYTKAFNLPLLAITSGEIAEKRKMTVVDWIEQQRQWIEKKSNHYGINVELRCQWNGHGYSFHDRFLMILHSDEKARVWSLGTSVNSLGNKHHVIQRVEHPQMIVDTFEELWNELGAEECLVWKKG